MTDWTFDFDSVDSEIWLIHSVCEDGPLLNGMNLADALALVEAHVCDGGK